MIKEFKKFLLDGDLVEVAIGLILALYIKTVVDSLVADIVTPIIAAIFGKPGFDGLTLGIGKGDIYYGKFLNAVISFVLVGFVLFLIVKAYNAAKERMRREPVPDAEVDEEIALLREIRDSLRQG